MFGKAHVMTLANGGTFPRFSKYSGVAPWADGYFLWINIDIDPNTGKSRNEYPNQFLRGGESVTWFGGSTMHPESATVQGLLAAGRAPHPVADPPQEGESEGGGEDEEGQERGKKRGDVVIFVREVKQPYSCFGRVRVDSVDLTTRPVRMTWRLLDYQQHLWDCKHFRRIVDLAS